MMFVNLLIANFVIRVIKAAEEKCDTSYPQDFVVCSWKHSTQCMSSTKPFCQSNLTSVEIDHNTYKDVMKQFLGYSVTNCCGPCQEVTNIQRYPSTIELTESINKKELSGSFVYPILGTKATTKMYQYHFLPVFKVNKATLMTLKPTGEDIINNLIIACLKLWPLLLIMVLMTLNAGCIIWVLDTWQNEEEFPRNFFHGFYQGFWWAFISMTTVGYGDKTAHSFIARIFAIFWILVGITVFSMLTATLTSIIQDATLSPSIDIAGKKLAVMKHNILDAIFVLKKGGIVHEEIRIDEMYSTLLSGRVYGLMTDFLSTTSARKENPVIDTLFDFQDIDFSSDGFVYGILVREENDFKYMKQFLNEHGMLFKTCLMQNTNNRNRTDDTTKDLFHPEHGMFWISLTSLMASLLLMLFAGATYEAYKIKFQKNKTDVKEQKKRY